MKRGGGWGPSMPYSAASSAVTRSMVVVVDEMAICLTKSNRTPSVDSDEPKGALYSPTLFHVAPLLPGLIRGVRCLFVTRVRLSTTECWCGGDEVP